MLGREKIANPFISLVVGKQGAKQGLFRGEVAGGHALGQAQQGRLVDAIHTALIAQPCGGVQR
jgi:hypothetical protein